MPLRLVRALLRLAYRRGYERATAEFRQQRDADVGIALLPDGSRATCTMPGVLHVIYTDKSL